MIHDQKTLVDLLLLHGLSSNECAGVVELLDSECPWFGEAEEVSEEIAIAMLADALPPKVTSLVTAPRLVAWHNRQARERSGFDVGAANVAYASLVQTVGRFGVEDGLGLGDFWVIEDSFSGPHATVMVFKPLPLPSGLASALAEWLSGQDAMRKVTLVNREGDALYEVSHK